MMFKYPRYSLSAILAASLAGIAGLAGATPSTSDPQASVPTVTYRSVFRETSLGVESDKVDWRKANDDVGKFKRGHPDILKQEEMEDKGLEKGAMPPTLGTTGHKH